ncbi:calcium/proton exchanger [Eremomyces bilateralis CBS 781.70]|uniref:Vacuolar calcium ion transporter n=1 Tax=Eremomyces bilateralis CBS 781.70 TaxID=1392243 RepID=A0A6G1G7L3_9PEZI|nr:calcium/proton exchanger [Eremomyces bilateralis CBS 781.70]KAF1814085.1 calcium/proton exchanger [Eremomyces bilateralis CBS 781.70]
MPATHPTNGERAPLIPNSTISGATPHGDSRIWGHADHSIFSRFPKATAHLTWLTLSSNYVNVLLIFVPLGILSGALNWGPIPTFVLNFLAIVPLAALLSFATEELSVKLGQTLGGLMNATFGNAVELIVSIVALARGEIRIVQASMLGSILSNILLVLGCCFLAAGIRGGEQRFNETVASTMSSLMFVSVCALIIPAALYSVVDGGTSNDNNILVLSHYTSIVLLFIYILYLFFQLRSHAYLFDEERTDEENSEETEVILKPIPASIALLVVTLIIALCADYLVATVDDIVATGAISKTFIGLILIPIVGNAAEHVTACIVAYKGKMDLAINVAIGSSMQIALFVTPFMVLLGWAIGQNMTLHFQGFETICFFLSVLVVNYLIQDGKSNYLEGVLCLAMYIIIAIAFYVYPDNVKDIGESIGPFFH